MSDIDTMAKQALPLDDINQLEHADAETYIIPEQWLEYFASRVVLRLQRAGAINPSFEIVDAVDGEQLNVQVKVDVEGKRGSIFANVLNQLIDETAASMRPSYIRGAIYIPDAALERDETLEQGGMKLYIRRLCLIEKTFFIVDQFYMLTLHMDIKIAHNIHIEPITHEDLPDEPIAV